jgi:ribosomal protein S18 acetylase RimI-like enzyme
MTTNAQPDSEARRGTVSIPVRPAVLADKPAILALADRLAAFGLTSRSASEVTTREREALAEALERAPSSSDVLVAGDGQRGVVGVLLMETRTDYFTREAHGHVSILAVAREAEGRGIGGALLDEAERWAARKGFRRLTLSVFTENLRAKALYARHGWEPELETYSKTLASTVVDEERRATTPTE